MVILYVYNPSREMKVELILGWCTNVDFYEPIRVHVCVFLRADTLLCLRGGLDCKIPFILPG